VREKGDGQLVSEYGFLGEPMAAAEDVGRG